MVRTVHGKMLYVLQRPTLKKLLTAMRLTILLLVTGCLQAWAGGAQTISLSLKNAPVEQAFRAIEKQTDYRFVYTKEDIAKANHVNLQVNNGSLADVLNLCFKDQPITYILNEKYIVVKNKLEKDQNVRQAHEDPPIDIKGKVLDETNNPIEGVTVSVKGTKKSTLTDANGDFFLHDVDANSILVFNSVNMEALEYGVKGATGFVMHLKAKITALGDVTVTPINTGYQVFKPNEITGSVTVITKQQLDGRIAPDIISKLEGITNGLAFNKDPKTGNNKLRIRGESTIFANANPLIVIDNFPYDGDINNINPNDVESITVLKDAAAASIWGVQAGNGVIVITTRKGKVNQPMRLEANTNITISGKPDLFYSPQLSPSSYINFESFLFNKGYYSAALSDPGKKAVSPIVEILNRRKLGQISANDSAMQIDRLRGNDLRYDMLKYIYRKPIYQQHQVNFSGGNARMNYYFSTGFDNDISSIIGKSSSRFTINSSSTFTPLKFIEFKIGYIYTENSSTNNGITVIPGIYPYMKLVDENGNENSIPQHREIFEDTIASHNFLNWKYYPLQERYLSNSKSTSNDTRLVAGLKLTILTGLSFEFSYQYEHSAQKGKNITSPQSYFIRDRYNSFAILNNGNFIGSNYNSQQLNRGQLNSSDYDLIGHYGRASLNYIKNIRNKHSITGMAGFEVRQVSTESNSTRLYGYDDATGSFVVPNLFSSYSVYPSMNSASIDAPGSGLSSTGTLNRFRSCFGDIGYTYNSRYTLWGSGRLDGSNYFGVNTNQKTVPLWSTGFKWDISKEAFYKFSGIPNLSLRLTYGFNGNLNREIAAITTVQYLNGAIYTGLPYAVINNIPNPELRWERTAHLNFGFDFSSKNDRVSGSIEYFKKRGSDLIGDAPVDPTTGISQIKGNFSAMDSKGIDFRIGIKNISDRFRWNVVFNLSYAAENVTRYDVSPAALSYLNAYSLIIPLVGKPLYSLYSYRWAGLDPLTGDPRVYLNDTLNKDYTSTTINNIKINNLIYNGRYNPPITGSVFAGLSWKNFNVNLNFSYKLGYYFRRSSINYTSLSNGWQNGHQDYDLRWQKPGDEIVTNVPSLSYPFSSTRDDFYNNSDVLIEKGDHIRLQFINVSYDFDKLLFKRLSIKSIRVFLYANNIGIVWRANEKDIDPDYPYLSFPPSRTFSLGMKVLF